MYLNTDLEIRGRAPLDVLIAALGDRVLVSHHSRERGRSFACLMESRSGLDRAPKRTLARWLALLRPLRGAARRALRESRVTMSIGYDADEGAMTSVRLDAEDVAALARLGVEIEVVVYRPDRMRRVRVPRVGKRAPAANE